MKKGRLPARDLRSAQQRIWNTIERKSLTAPSVAFAASCIIDLYRVDREAYDKFIEDMSVLAAYRNPDGTARFPARNLWSGVPIRRATDCQIAQQNRMFEILRLVVAGLDQPIVPPDVSVH